VAVAIDLRAIISLKCLRDRRRCWQRQRRGEKCDC